MIALAACHWLEPGGETAATRITAFLDRIGLPLHIGPVRPDRLIPGMDVQGGVLWIEPFTPLYPGDLLHEAGHIAVTDPAIRATLSDIAEDPAEEMAAIAWSWAAAQAAGIDAATLFHDHGYKGGGSYLVDAFSQGRWVGLPMLIYYGMTDAASYPAMTRWLR